MCGVGCVSSEARVFHLFASLFVKLISLAGGCGECGGGGGGGGGTDKNTR